MQSLYTPENIMFLLNLLGMGFLVYNSLKKPQIQSDKKDALLAQQVQWQIEASERKFKEVQESFQSLLLQSNNHIHTVDTKVENLSAILSETGKEITKLSTIIEERIPKRV